MANLVIITGPMAVGKMTVAEELQKRIGYNLMINHDSIEVSDKIFGFATPSQSEFNQLIRKAAIETTIKYNESMIFTITTDFSNEKEYEYHKNLKKMFEENGGHFYFVELIASLDERLKRNVTENRLQKKKSKQDIEWSNKNVIQSNEKYKLNSNTDEYWFDSHIKINNENLVPQEVANVIIRKYQLKPEFKEKKENSNKMY